MRKKQFLVVLTTVCMLTACLTGCGKQESVSDATTQQEVVNEDVDLTQTEENYDTEDATLDFVRNDDGIGEQELLVVSFGTSYNDNRRLTIGAIEKELEESFPDYSVRRGFTSQIIIDHIKKRDNIAIDNVTEALERAVANNVKILIIQPTHLMDGFEYNDVINEIAGYAEAFEKVVVGKPLLTSDEDFKDVMNAIVEDTKQYNQEDTAICFMGHGTEAESNAVYQKMQDMLTESGHNNYFIGTVEAAPTLQDVVDQVKQGGYKKVVLQPLMVVAGDHANNDMAGDEEDSWKSVFEKEGFEVVCNVRGLGEIPAIVEIYKRHAEEAIKQLDEINN